ncbi:hypothetical protein NDK47_18785 [Brevibacillus ruminantium]|uniref:DUF4926 domain-containing protein n=1 Tax=Brevibacillus ruminantium TaxID=2950604 RepID=A0ABY4WAL4_9BACL|nr:hypothetical protein [Brevibacillus ruminantium]USG64190.1 hypothetical protein NDK47_18785 [Brevibacillus ruminantium]
MYSVGETVIYVRDGAKGIILEVKDERYLVMWEDTFVSWETAEQLQKA